jgi:hypothetical protein
MCPKYNSRGHKMDNRCVLVVGTGRSGTSAVAGVLHRLGVDMGENFVGADANNKYGTYEEIDFFVNHRAYMDGQFDDFWDWLPQYITKRTEKSPVWGIKEPLLVHTFPKIASMVENPIVVFVHRNRDASILSYEYAYRTRYSEAVKWYEENFQAFEQNRAEWDGWKISLDFEDLCEAPEQMVHWLAKTFDGVEPPSDRQISDAVEHIRPIASRWDRNGRWVQKQGRDMDGWGNIAIATRIAKSPEFKFFNSWTKLLTGGLKSGDTVLMPQGWMPAHWAANAAMRDFLKTGRDALLMVDDDMEFEMFDVEKMRTNEANWDYDIVSAFCTNREWPPRPITYRLQDEQPGPPMSLHGDSFDRLLVDGTETIPVDAVGFAFTLIKRKVIEAMTGEYGPMHSFYARYDRGMESEDIYFSRQARELGFKIGVDLSVRINHLGSHPYGWTEYKTYLDTMLDHAKPHVDIDAARIVGILEESMPYLSESRADAEVLLASVMGAEDAEQDAK